MVAALISVSPPPMTPPRAERAGGIGDQDSLLAQVSLHIVQRLQLFARVGQARDDRRDTAGAVDQLVVVESVQGLAQLEGEVVSHIDDVVARALAD